MSRGANDSQTEVDMIEIVLRAAKDEAASAVNGGGRLIDISASVMSGNF